MRKLRKLNTRRQGAATVEFALIAPLLFLLIFGIIEFGQVFYVQLVLTNASREGCREACLDGSSLQTSQHATRDYLSAFDLDNATIDIDPDPAEAGFRDTVTVTVSYPFAEACWLGQPFFVKGELTATSTMRTDKPQ